MTNSKRNTLIVIVISVAILITVVLNSHLFFARIDLTESGAYTISEVSRNLFLEIDNTVNITYYLSDRLRTRAVEVEQIADIILQYASYSRGRIAVRVVDPTLEGNAQEIESVGIAPRQIQVIEEDQQSIAVVYSGIVINYLDRSHVLPFVIDPSALEYELTSAIRNLVRDTQQVVGIIVGDERRVLDSNYQTMAAQLRQELTIESLLPGGEIDSALSAVLVIGASSLNEEDIFFLDQYLMNGGRILYAIDTVTINTDISFAAVPHVDLPIYRVLEQYGIRIGPSFVADEYNLRIPSAQDVGGNFRIQQLVPYPYWVTVLDSGRNVGHPITSRFSGLDLFWASPVFAVASDDERITTLLTSSPDSWLIEREPYFTDPQEAVALSVITDSENRRPLPLAVSLNGAIQSGYREALPDIVEGDPNFQFQSRTNEGRLVVIGDTDFLSSIANYTRSNYNFSFLSDTISWLVNDPDLLTIKTRSNRNIRLNALPPEQKQSVLNIATIVNVLLIPLIVVIIGILRFIARRRNERMRADLHGNAGAE